MAPPTLVRVCAVLFGRQVLVSAAAWNTVSIPRIAALAGPSRAKQFVMFGEALEADRALDWLEKNKAKPCFLYLPFNAVHAPLQAPKKYLDRFPNIADEKRKTFAAMMSAMDDAVGRVLGKIRETGQEENTLIWFLSDNGGPTESTTSKNGPLRGFKRCLTEGGIRTAFGASWPGVIADSTLRAPSSPPRTPASMSSTGRPQWPPMNPATRPTARSSPTLCTPRPGASWPSLRATPRRCMRAGNTGLDGRRSTSSKNLTEIKNKKKKAKQKAAVEPLHRGR